jgi:MFS transporter, FSR family, fosmidomycin resistance protein
VLRAVNARVLTLMLGHFTVDSYAGVTPVLYPLLIQRFQLSFETVGLTSLAYTGVSSVSQPLFGWLADRFGTRYTGFALAWTAICYSAIGLAPSFPVLLLLAAGAGLGSGAFHPNGALNVSAALDERRRNAGMSIYVTGGTLGVALGPLLGVAAFYLLGLRGTTLLVAPGIVIGAFLLRQLGALHMTSRAPAPAGPPRAIPLLALAVVIGLMMSRSWTVFVLESFAPTWYKTLGYPATFYGPLATTIVLASAVGTVGAGGLADRYGRRAVIVGSLVVSVPAVLLYASFPGPQGFLTGALVGLLAASTGPLMLVMAQQLMSRRAGLASGLVLGLGFVTGAIGVPVTGAIADRFGLQPAMELQALIVLVTIPLGLLLPSEERLRSITGRRVDPVAQLAAGGKAVEVLEE